MKVDIVSSLIRAHFDGVTRDKVGATSWEHFDAATKAVVSVARAEALREYEQRGAA